MLFPLILIFSLFGDKGKQANWFLIRIWSIIWFFLIGIVSRVEGLEYVDKSKSYIIVANHISYLDTAMIFRCIPFYAKPLAKAELGKIPLFGFLYKQLAVMVYRDDDKSKSQSIQALKQHLNQKGSIFIFPEGTFNETEAPLKSFYDGAFRIAKETHTPILPIVFPDTKKRMHFSSIFSFKPGLSRAIFLPEIPLDIIENSDVIYLKETVKQRMEHALRLAYKN